jgi:hypothetical protein
MTAKYLTAIISLVFLLVSFFQCKSQFTKWESNKTISNIEFEKVRYKLSKQDTVLVIGYLKKETIIESYPCAEGLVHFTKSFNLQAFRLSSPLKLEKYEIEKDTWVSLEKAGYYICSFPKEKTIQGFTCIGSKSEDGPKVTFDNQGNIRSFFSVSDVKIGDIYCSGGKSNEIGILKNGHLGYCKLSIDQNINDTNYKEGSILFFDYNGNVSLIK